MTPVELVAAFYATLSQDRVDDAFAVAADDITFKNVGMPTVRGKRRVLPLMKVMNGGVMSLDADLLTIAAPPSTGEATVVLSERWDEFRLGPLRVQLLVCGHNEVRDGQITVWHDTFDYLSGLGALLKGIAALAFPRILPPLQNPMSLLPGLPVRAV